MGSWSPPRLTPAQLEARRLEAARLLKAGRLKPAAIARELGVSRQSVHRWQHTLLTAGRAGAGLRSAPPPGHSSATRPVDLLRSLYSLGAWVRSLGAIAGATTFQRGHTGVDEDACHVGSPPADRPEDRKMVSIVKPNVSLMVKASGRLGS